MLRRTLSVVILLASLALAGGNAFAADPTLHEVYQAAEAGNYREAQVMMDQVLRDHPNSAKAHLVEAELLAKQGRLSEARGELATAERLQPGLPFAKPGSVEELKARLAPSYPVGQPVTSVPAAATGFPWGPLLLVVGLVALVVLVVRTWRARSRSVVQGGAMPSYGGAVAPPSYGAATAQPYGVGGVGPIQPAGGIGSGILGGLATGAAMGAGVVAGEALMHRALGGHRSDDGLDRLANPQIGSSADDSFDKSQYDMGGDDFGVSDASSWDDSSSGGDDWA